MANDYRNLPIHLNDDDQENHQEDQNTGTAVVSRPQVKEPPLYKVILHNDDFTPMEFVVLVLEKFFNKKHEEATEIMLHVHNKGYGVCGVYPYEIAETKVALVTETAKGNQYPLKCTMEKA